MGSGGDCSGGIQRGLCEQCLPGTKGGQPMAADPQPEGSKCLYRAQTLQDGGHSGCEGPPEPGRIHVQARPKGCLPLSPDQSFSSEVSPIQMGGEVVPIQGTPIWSGHSPASVYKAPETGISSPEEGGHEADCVLGRSSDHWQEQEGGREGISPDKGPFGESRICGESRKITGAGHADNRVFGLHHQLSPDDLQAAPDKGAGDQEGVQASTSGRKVNGAQVGPYCGDLIRSTVSCNPSTITLPRSSGFKDRRSSPPPLIRVDSFFERTGSEGPGMVGGPPQGSQWESDSSGASGVGHRVGCFQHRLGGSLERSEDRWSLDSRGIQAPHKCQGAAGSFLSAPDVRQAQAENTRAFEDRQCYSSVLHQQDGRNPLQSINGTGSRDVGVEPVQEHSDYSRTSPWKAEHGGRPGVTNERGQLRVDPELGSVSAGDGSARSVSGGPFCVQAISAASAVHELEAGPWIDCYRCSESVMEGNQRVCLSSFLPDWEVSFQDQEGGSTRADSGSTSLANTAVVCSPAIVAVSKTNNSAEPSILAEKSPERGTSINTPAESSRVASVRASLESQGISKGASALILSSWRKATETAYSCSWRRWEQWCVRSGYSSIRAPLNAVLDFLASEYAEGKQYRTINSYRSAISMTHMPIDGVVVGKHPLVSRLLKGVFNSRPPQPRYAATWDVGQVLEHIASLGRNENLSLKRLSHKLAVLLALSNASRASELYALDTRYMSRDEGGISFTIAELTKTARPGKKKAVHYPPFKGEGKLCPVRALNEYLQRTDRSRREDQSRTRLFLSVVKPFNPVGKSTIARWMKAVIHEAGVDKHFNAHSIRGAAATAASMQGMSLSDIMNIADWSSENVFKTFYYRPSEQRPRAMLDAIIRK